MVHSVPIKSSRVEFKSILKYYLYNGVYPINCLKYIIYIMRVYASLMQVKIRNTTCRIISMVMLVVEWSLSNNEYVTKVVLVIGTQIINRFKGFDDSKIINA